ncbi:MAG: enoyl-CoA hydratase/isomerase family protein, partial [Chloroflexi bacterium]|nr:enoyl-CoA hydratase/isomerase family protein [Chloroflexota bacterium]
MDYRTLLVETTDRVCRVTLNRPEAHNAMNDTMRDELIALFEAQRDDPETKVIVITGAGTRSFSSGGDVKRMGQRGVLEQRESLVKMARFVNLLTTIEKPVITALNGLAIGAGATLAIASDIAIASEKAKLSFGFIRMGSIPIMGSLYFLPRVVGPSRAKRL